MIDGSDEHHFEPISHLTFQFDDTRWGIKMIPMRDTLSCQGKYLNRLIFNSIKQLCSNGPEKPNPNRPTHVHQTGSKRTMTSKPSK